MKTQKVLFLVLCLGASIGWAILGMPFDLLSIWVQGAIVFGLGAITIYVPIWLYRNIATWNWAEEQVRWLPRLTINVRQFIVWLLYGTVFGIVSLFWLKFLPDNIPVLPTLAPASKHEEAVTIYSFA